MIDSSPHSMPRDTGWIEVITGCMFSGKTEELIKRLRRATFAKQKIIIFKPEIDKRFSQDSIVSHSAQSLPSTTVSSAEMISGLVQDAQVIGIDEAQFFDSNLLNVCKSLANSGRRVIVAGLDQDYKGEPFEPIPFLLAEAEYITKLLAICVICGNPADRTQRKPVNETGRILLGASDIYEARCRKCHSINNQKS